MKQIKRNKYLNPNLKISKVPRIQGSMKVFEEYGDFQLHRLLKHPLKAKKVICNLFESVAFFWFLYWKFC